MGDLYALDFDGVLCDSCGESSLSALKAAKIRWPNLFVDVDVETEEWIVDQMHVVRPVVETGYENVLLVRLLLEICKPTVQTSSVSSGLTIDAILERWLGLKHIIMKEWNEDRDGLIELFGKVRDEWIERDFAGWINANRFADALLRELAGVEIPSERIFGLGTGPKVEVLKQLQDKPENMGLTLQNSSKHERPFSYARYHGVSSRLTTISARPPSCACVYVHVPCVKCFVEDRLATLKNVIKEPDLDKWNLYLGKWGYNTEKERQEAEGILRIHLLELSDFSRKLK